MTAEEKREQKVELMLDYQYAEEELAHLREKACRMAERFSDIACWLSGARGYAGGLERERLEIAERVTGGIDSYRQNVNIENAIKAMDEVQKADRKLADLAKRKQALGIK